MAKLYIVPTPIGNLEDITLRALRILKEVDLIVAEDTRTSSVLLNHYEIKKPLMPYHKFNEHNVVETITQRIASGQDVALVSDAGTPGISDPGFLLVRACLDKEIDVETLPGATAFVPALLNSGFPCDKFCFEGFLPHKKGKQTMLTALSEEKRTIILYESPHRIIKTLEMIKEIFVHNPLISASRELTKKFETTVRGTAEELIEYFTNKPPKGEFVVVIEGNKTKATKDGKKRSYKTED
ncbi:MAG: 16S rRNA (cytidine(1402)-2'-O)-methyltransferase [Rikenellaceae bacterium]